MADGMRTDSGLMIKTEKDVDGVADRLTSMLTSLLNELTPLQDAWKGSAGGTFQQVKDRFDKDMGHLNRSLRSLAEAVGSSGRDYTVSDDEMRSEMDKAGASAGSITQALKL
jgi:WXG100 family type VII secretion target